MSQDLSAYEKHSFVFNADSMPYRLLLPEKFDRNKKYPILFVLHGSGERGNDNESQLAHGAQLFLKAEIRKAFPAIIIFPQCPADSYWSNVERNEQKSGRQRYAFVAGGQPTKAMVLLQELVFETVRKFPVDTNRIYIAGLSMGGMGTFEIVNRNPFLFAAAIAICGGADPAIAKNLKHTKWWLFHGEKDDIVDPSFSIDMAAALKKEQANVKFTLYPNANHNAWDPAFAEPELLPWLFSQSK